MGLAKRPDLIISTHLNFAGPALWLKRAAGIPYWLVAHGIEAWDIKRPMVRRALHEAERVLAVSSFTRDRLVENECLNPNRISLLPDTFDAGRFTIAPKPEHLLQRYNLSPDQPVILTVSRLCSAEQYKGYDKILDAMVRIRAAVPRVRYILAGRGDDRKRIERQIVTLGLEDAVTLAGFVPDEELCAHYNLCDVFAMPSKGEGFGIVFLEALACGKPALAGNKDGSVDALCYGDLGALVDPDDTGLIAESLIQLLRGSYPNPLMFQPEKLREQVIRAYGYERFTQTLAGLFEDFFSAQRKVA
jgi:glycosyltransferase involved in cell wall biosynthesis